MGKAGILLKPSTLKCSSWKCLPLLIQCVCVCDYSMEEACRFHALNALMAVFSHSVRKMRWWNIVVTNNGQFLKERHRDTSTHAFKGSTERVDDYIFMLVAALSTQAIYVSFSMTALLQCYYDSLWCVMFSSNHWSTRQGCDWMISMGLLASQSCSNKSCDSNNRNLFSPSSGS